MTALDAEMFGADQPCFGCGPNHAIGFHLRFSVEGETVTTRFTATDQHQGPPGLMHGGLILTLADELAAWTLVGQLSKFGFTAKVDARLLRPVKINEEVSGYGKLGRVTSRTVHVDVRLAQGGVEVFAGTFVFAMLSANAVEKMIGRELPEAWRRFTR